jgi:hypothetical protein
MAGFGPRPAASLRPLRRRRQSSVRACRLALRCDCSDVRAGAGMGSGTGRWVNGVRGESALPTTAAIEGLLASVLTHLRTLTARQEFVLRWALRTGEALSSRAS